MKHCARFMTFQNNILSVDFNPLKFAGLQYYSALLTVVCAANFNEVL